MNAQIDLTAKLLATENLTIVRVNASTASFDIQSRILYIPVWKEMTPEIETMLIAHEVGHALFTSADKWGEALDRYEDFNTKKTIKGYMNVIEDARIERLMKRRYPGLRKAFNAGYKQLMDRDFFKLRGVDLNSMNLIDKINVYYKVSTAITFDAVETTFLERAGNTETLDEVVQLAIEMYEYSKLRPKQCEEQSTEETNKTKALDVEDLGDDAMSESSDDITDELEPDENGESSDDVTDESKSNDDNESNDESDKSSDSSDSSESNAESTDEDVESKTDKELTDALEKLTDGEILYRYYELNTNTPVDPIVDFKTIIKDIKSQEVPLSQLTEVARSNREVYMKSFEKFKTQSNRIVSYLVKEFEMKKAANNYARTLTSKSGSLNSSRLHAYKLTDDIFKKITVVPNGKNHGIVFLLDWSGSMSKVMKPTIEQVINLVMFCRKIGIPFEVFAFSTQYHRIGPVVDAKRAWAQSMQSTANKPIIFSRVSYSLLNLFSSKMTTTEFNFMMYNFTSSPNRFKGKFALGATPLNDALVHMIKYIPNYKQSNNIEKLTFITLTDGDGEALGWNVAPRPSEYKYDQNSYKIQKYKNIINDSMTGKSYELTEYANNHTKVLLSIIKDRYSINSIGFYITGTKKSDTIRAISTMTVSKCTVHDVEAAKAAYKKDGFYALGNTGRDDCFIIPDNRTDVVDCEFEIDRTDSAAQIARQITKSMHVTKHSRVLLDKFISYVA